MAHLNRYDKSLNLYLLGGVATVELGDIYYRKGQKLIYLCKLDHESILRESGMRYAKRFYDLLRNTKQDWVDMEGDVQGTPEGDGIYRRFIGNLALDDNVNISCDATLVKLFKAKADSSWTQGLNMGGVWMETITPNELQQLADGWQFDEDKLQKSCSDKLPVGCKLHIANLVCRSTAITANWTRSAGLHMGGHSPYGSVEAGTAVEVRKSLKASGATRDVGTAFWPFEILSGGKLKMLLGDIKNFSRIKPPPLQGVKPSPKDVGMMCANPVVPPLITEYADVNVA